LLTAIFLFTGAILDCRAAIYLLVGAIHQLQCYHIPRGRRNPPIAMPQFFKRPAQYPGCRAAIFEEAGSIPCYILEEIEWTGVVEVGGPLVHGWLG
jgi:hypothetical protein